MLEIILSSFSLVAVGEMGDKTQLLAFALASRFRKPWVILGGILVATLLNHSLASVFGQWVAIRLDSPLFTLLLSLSFFGFGFWSLFPDSLGEIRGMDRFGPFFGTIILFFLAEMGDKTQILTAALAARFQSPIGVTFGSTLGMMLSDGLAVFLGDQLSHRLQGEFQKRLRWIAATLFFCFGAVSLVSALQQGMISN